MKKRFISLLLVVLLSSLLLFGGDNIEKDKAAIKKVLLSAYLDGSLNVGDVAAIKKGFHSEFNMLSINSDGAGIKRSSLDWWIQAVERRKKEGTYPPAELVSFKFLMIDVVGRAGFAKIEFYRGKRLTYTDFLSLYKFNDGWKLVAKIYGEH